MSGEQMLKLGCPREREGACVSVCSHCAKVFPVAISALTPTFPSLSPNQVLAFGAHRHFHRGRAEPHHSSHPSHPPKLFVLPAPRLFGFVLECPGSPRSWRFFLFVLTPASTA